MSIILATAATAKPVTKSEVKSQLRLLTGSSEDALLDRLIASATAYTESQLGRALIAQTWDLYLDAFPPSDNHKIKIPKPPTISISYIKYWDGSDVEQTWSSSKYVLDNAQQYHSLVYPAINQAWPSPRIFPKAVNVRFVAGYSDSGASPLDLADNVPDDIKLAIVMLIGHLYENREDTSGGFVVKQVPRGFDALISNYKIASF